MIEPHPEHVHIKFLVGEQNIQLGDKEDTFVGNGYGLLVATNHDKTLGIVLSNGGTESTIGHKSNDVKFGKLCLVREINPDHHPVFVCVVHEIPENTKMVN